MNHDGSVIIRNRQDKTCSTIVSQAMDDDQKIVEHVARQFIDRHGKCAPDILRQHADIDATQGNGLSTQAWLDIAEAAKRLLRG